MNELVKKVHMLDLRQKTTLRDYLIGIPWFAVLCLGWPFVQICKMLRSR